MLKLSTDGWIRYGAKVGRHGYKDMSSDDGEIVLFILFH